MNLEINPGLAPRRDALAATVAWIELRLHQPLSLDLIAAEAGLSPYHFSRLFTARMGRSVMAHVRGRRLVRSARRLVDDPGLKVIDLALDSGFESQEAFTRAFKRVFGVAPGRFRGGFSIAPIEGQYPVNIPDANPANVIHLEAPARLDAFTVAGYSRQFDDSTKSQIPQLWSRLIGSLPFEGQVKSWNTYGVVWNGEAGEGSFHYLAGVAVRHQALLPAGMETKEIPAAMYAVFRITLNGGPLHPQIKAAMARIWGALIPQANLKVANSPDFEIYDGEFSPNRAGAFIDFHVPIES